MTSITNAEGKIWLALKSRIDDWTETEKMYQGETFQPTASEPFIIVQDVALETETAAINPDCGEALQGLINISVMAPLTWNWAHHKGLCGRLSDFLNTSGIMTYSDAQVRFTQRPRVIGSPRLDEGHNRVELQCQYRCWG